MNLPVIVNTYESSIWPFGCDRDLWTASWVQKEWTDYGI